MSDRVEPTAQERALERLISSLMQRVDTLEAQAARSADDNATALAAVGGHDARLATLESAGHAAGYAAAITTAAPETGQQLAAMEAPFTYRSPFDQPRTYAHPSVRDDECDDCC